MTPEEFKDFRINKLGYATRRELADEMGVTFRAIEHWEYGRRPIPLYAERLLKCLLLAKMVREGKQCV